MKITFKTSPIAKKIHTVDKGETKSFSRKLTKEDLKKLFTTPREDHPARKT